VDPGRPRDPVLGESRSLAVPKPSLPVRRGASDRFGGQLVEFEVALYGLGVRSRAQCGIAAPTREPTAFSRAELR
jgi:hypothetical protein